MTWRKNKNHHTNYCAKWRNSSLGKTNPNHQYFSRLLKKETNDYLTSNKEYLLANEPEIYYSMKGQKQYKAANQDDHDYFDQLLYDLYLLQEKLLVSPLKN